MNAMWVSGPVKDMIFCFPPYIAIPQLFLSCPTASGSMAIKDVEPSENSFILFMCAYVFVVAFV
jgi:hypothetical protein